MNSPAEWATHQFHFTIANSKSRRQIDTYKRSMGNILSSRSLEVRKASKLQVPSD